jgi:hypothetical protein
MKLGRYNLKSVGNFTVFEFVSEGPLGTIKKIIQFQSTNEPNLFNLAFGDKILKDQEFDDLVVSNNGDSEKVLATLVAALYVFLIIILMHLFVQQAVQKQDLDFIEWVFQNSMSK